MQWHQERQRILAENVSNSDTPNFRPRELVEPTFDKTGISGMRELSMVRTSANHIQAARVSEAFGSHTNGGYETRPAGNAVNIEDEMLKVATNQTDYAAAASLYSKSLDLIKTAIGKR